MNQLIESNEFFEVDLAQYTFCSSGATNQDFLGFELPQKEHGEDAKSSQDKIIRQKQIGLLERNLLRSRGDSPLTLVGDLWSSKIDVPESPFDTLDEKLSDEEKTARLIDYIRDKSDIQFASELATRLEFLHQAVMEDPDEISISPESLTPR